jgi:hypothetical protein
MIALMGSRYDKNRGAVQRDAVELIVIAALLGAIVTWLIAGVFN